MSKSDVCRRQILTSKVGPGADRVKREGGGLKIFFSLRRQTLVRQHSYWSLNVCLNIKISKCLVSN